MRSFLLVVFFGLAGQVMAQDGRSHLLHNAAVVDEDGRKTEEEYASSLGIQLSEVQNRFAATGVISCPNDSLSGQLTGSASIITTAAHGFFEMETCKPTQVISKCTFTVKIGDRSQTSRISKLIGTGLNCSAYRTLTHNDWAVFTIDPPIEGIAPYRLPEKIEIATGLSVTSVSSMARDFRRPDPRTGRLAMVKTIEDCSVKSARGINFPTSIDSNCDFARGSSGGSLLMSKPNGDTLVAINVSNDETEKALQAAEKRGTPNRGQYNEDKWGTYSVALAGNFLRALRTAVDGRQSKDELPPIGVALGGLDPPANQGQRRVQQILFDTYEDALAAKERVSAGLSFEALAAERGLKPAGIDLGVLKPELFGNRDVREAALAARVGDVTLVKTMFGATLIKVILAR